MAALISLMDLSDATGIAPDLLAAEAAMIQREAQLGPPPPSERRPTLPRDADADAEPVAA